MFKRNHFLMSALGGEGGSNEGGSGTGDTDSGDQPSGDTGTPAPQGVTIPDNWKEAIPEEFRGEKSLDHIKSVGDMAKSYINAQKHMGADKILVPGEYATDEDWSNIYGKLGRPETADGYDVSLGEESKITADTLAALKGKAHELGMSTKQLKGLLDYQEAQISIAEKSFNDGIKSRLDGAVDTLKAEWGTDYERRLSTAANMVGEFGGPDLQKYLNETGYGNDPMLIKTFYKIAEGMGEGKFLADDKTQGSGYTPEGAQKEIEKIMKEPAMYDKMHPKHAELMEKKSKLFQYAYPITE